MSNRLVVCGTDTEVGKTVVSALLVQGLGAHYWKPVQCGLEDGEGDRDRVQRWLALPDARIIPEAYRLQAPVSPHWATELESGDPAQPGPPLDPQRLELPNQAGPLVVETAGGLLVPLRLDWLQIDQLQRWQLPVLLVARSGLGTLNHTLLSLEALRHRQIPVLGVLLNGPAHPNNLNTLAQLGGVPMLGCLPPLAAVNAATLAQQWQELELSHKLQA
ncbi:dethiobiotin synthase [Synechococcus sp. CB0101]|jgi:dethiobiotin synthetase|uniref:dethiobiotin synthase n=1 Tax=Synechococcus sp. CB0101 TaxID=232348 RepID=UPI0002001DF5|nr:dethiobiotin synthase [Synechococcus sp. CB0101]QCH14694.1 dethiobiotin synthase [Synechococcus sp. CB0101]